MLGGARNRERLTVAAVDLAAHGPGRFEGLCIDLTSQDAPELVAAWATERWEALDIVVHSAGVMLHNDGGLMAEPEGVLEDSLNMNLLAPFRLTRALLPLLRKGREPRIINVGSGAGTLYGLTEPGIRRTD